MLCRALCAVAVVSYVLCVLLLSGVQKEDLDAATLRKLQRHNVNIADIDGKIRDQCFATKAATRSSTTQQVELKIEPNKYTTTEISTELNTENSPSASELRKILYYFKQKETRKEPTVKETTTKSNFILNDNIVDLSKLPSSVQSRVLKEIASSRTESPINRNANKDNERFTLAHDDHELQNIEKVQQGRSTRRLVPDNPITEKPNDLEYISKIVAQILAQRQLNQRTTTTPAPPAHYFDSNKLAQDIHSLLEKDLSKKIPPNFYLNNLNLTDTFENLQTVEPKKNGDEKDVIDALLSQLKNRDRLPTPYLLGSLKKNTDFAIDQINKRLVSKLGGTGGNNIQFKNRNDLNKPAIVSRNTNVPVVEGQFLSKWQNVNTDAKTKSFGQSFLGNKVRCLIFSQSNEPCKMQNNEEVYPNNAYGSLWPYIIDGLSKGELKIQDVQKISSMYWPAESKVKPEMKNDLNLDNRYKSEWVFNGRSGEQFQFKEKYIQNTANDPLGNNEPTMEYKFKNIWTDYYEDPRFKQQYNSFGKNKLLRIPEKLILNEDEISPVNQPKTRQKSSETVQRLILNPNKDPDLGKQYKSNNLYVIRSQSKEAIGKSKSIPPGVIKEIADSVKELVLRDLKKELSTTIAARTTSLSTTLSTTTPTTTMTTTTTRTTTPATTTQTTTTTKKPTTTTTITTTTEKLSTTIKEDHVKIQEASKALEKFMEVYEKFKSIKDSIVVPENNTRRYETNKNINIKEVNNDRPPYSVYDIRNQMKRPKPLILDPYTDPTTNTPDPIKIRSTKKPHAYALTLQTNSDEIPPLNVAVSKPLSMHNNIVVTPLPSRLRGRNLHQSRYSGEARYRRPERYQVAMTETQSALNPSKISYRDPLLGFKYGSRSKARNNKKERGFKERGYKTRGVEKFHEKLERADNWQRYGPGDNKCSESKENCNEQVASRNQRPLVNTGTSYDDTHFRNFLKTQQKVTDMLERILATNTKQIPRSTEII